MQSAEYFENIQLKLGDITFRLEENWRNYNDNVGYYSLLGSASPLDDGQKKLVADGLLKLANELAARHKQIPYQIPVDHFVWGSNSDFLDAAMIYANAYEVSKEQKYFQQSNLLQNVSESIDQLWTMNGDQFADQMKQQGATGLAEWQVAEFIEDHQVGVHQPIGETSRFAGLFFLFQLIDQLDGGQEADPEVMVLDRLYCDGGGQVRLAGTRPTLYNQHAGLG